MKKIILILIGFLPLTFVAGQESEIISLSGQWRVALDVFNTGITEEWYVKGLPTESDQRLREKLFFKGVIDRQPETFYLPGTANDNQVGKKLVYRPEITGGLERLYGYDGILWFEREVIIPEHWRDKPVKLFLERVPGRSKVWWDGVPKGDCSNYATPHSYNIVPSADPGKFRLIIMVNNTPFLEMGSHHIASGSGARWNGIVGRIELQSESRKFISNIRVSPDIRSKNAMVKITMENQDDACKGILSFSVRRKGSSDSPVTRQTIQCQLVPGSGNVVETEVPIPEPVILWDEFNPELYELTATLIIDGNQADHKETSFGMREMSVKNTEFLLNGQPLFLRGTLDCGQYPLKADPIMDKETWLYILGVYKQYGLNHVRFHTWCPPEAAFQAADELGLIFQVEMVSAPYSELLTILDTYGNHPSLALVSLHNEKSHNEKSRQIIEHAREYDSRHLYCCTSHPWQPGCTDDFYVSAWGVDKKRTVGIQWGGGDVLSATRFNTHLPETETDYRDAIQGIDAPMVSHEMGQWAIYPDLSEIPLYNGVLRNLNYENIKKDLWKKGLLSQSLDFIRASGKLSLLLYKEEIESTLRTPRYGGFQLLDIHDFQGQQVSIVGILNAFWESKGLITPEEFREFCSPAVPLLRMKKRVWMQDEAFEGVAELAYFGHSLKSKIQPVWRIIDENGYILAQGKFDKKEMKSRGLSPLGEVRFALNNLPAPAKLQFVLEIPEINALNRWDFWLYPPKVNVAVPEDVKVFSGWSEDVKKALSDGQKVLLFPAPEDLPGSRAGCFTPVFWNPLMKWRGVSHTMGLLCNPESPIFDKFPTEFHTNWQWWDIIMNSRVMVLDKLPVKMKPLIQVVDNFVTNQKLGCVFECKVGKGKLLVCSLDLNTDLGGRPASRQFRHSLLQYMHGSEFNPEYEFDMNLLQNIFE